MAVNLVAQAPFDEMPVDGGSVREAYGPLKAWLDRTHKETLARKRREADLLFRRLGITFAVGRESGDVERLIPFDVIPRVLSAEEWAHLARGLEQRVRALNAFLGDIYHGQDIFRAGCIQARLVLGNAQYRPEMQGYRPPRDIYVP